LVSDAKRLLKSPSKPVQIPIKTTTLIGPNEKLKEWVVSADSLSVIDYAVAGQELTQHRVILVVDSSVLAVGWILLQLDKEGKHRPSWYGKIELYRQFHTLQVNLLHLVGLPIFNVEVDAKYIHGMLNNPDRHPNAAMNRWIFRILLFDFYLVHVAGKDHKGPDRLSRRRKTKEDTVEREGGEF
jgi:hypothetical protein